MSFCAYCGTELTRDANFCFHCGKKVVKLPDNNMKDLATDNENLTHQHFDNESLLEIIKERRDKGEFSRLSIVNKNLYLNSKLLGGIGEIPLYKENTYILSLQNKMKSLEKVQLEQMELFNKEPSHDGLYDNLIHLYEEITEINDKIRDAEKATLKILYLTSIFRDDSQISGLRKNVIDKLLEGDSSSSISMLYKENVVPNDMANSEQAKAYIENEQLLLWLLLSAGLHKNNPEYELRFNGYADKLIQFLIQPSSIEVCVDYWKEKKQSDLREEYLRKLVDAIEKRNYPRDEEYSWCCYYLGDALEDNQKSDEAFRNVKAAYDIIHSENSLTPDSKDLLIRCLNLLILLCVNDETDSVEKTYFKEAISIFADSSFNDSFLKCKIIGNHLYVTERLCATDDNYSLMYDVVDILQKYVDVDPYGYEKILADQKRYLSGCCVKDRIKDKDGIAESEDAVSYVEMLYRKNPPAFSYLLLLCMMNRAEAYSKNGDNSHVIECYRNAISELEKFIPLADEQFIKNFGGLYSGLALQYEDNKKVEEALDARYKGIGLQKLSLARSNNESMDYLAFGFMNIASLYEETDFSKAEVYLKEACSIYDQLAKLNIEKYNRDCAYSYSRLASLYKHYYQFEEAKAYYEKAQIITNSLGGMEAEDELLREEAIIIHNSLAILDATIKRNIETFGWNGDKLNPVRQWGTKGTFAEPSSDLEQNALKGDPKAIFDLSDAKDKGWEEREKAIKWMIYGGDLGYYLHYCRAAYSIIYEVRKDRRVYGASASMHAIERLDDIYEKLLAGIKKVDNEKLLDTAKGAICSVELELCISYVLMSTCCDKDCKEKSVRIALETIRKCVSNYHAVNEQNFYNYYWYCVALLKNYIVNKEVITQGEMERALGNMPKVLSFIGEDVRERGISECIIGLMYGYGIGVEKNTNTAMEYYQRAKLHGTVFSGVLQDFDTIQP